MFWPQTSTISAPLSVRSLNHRMRFMDPRKTAVINLIIMSTLLFGAGYSAGKEFFAASQKKKEVEDRIRNSINSRYRSTI